jgi:hypothetical protein
MRFGKHPNQPETGVNLRQHVRYTDTDGFATKTGERGDHSKSERTAHDGYSLYARRPRSSICDQSVEPARGISSWGVVMRCGPTQMIRLAPF